MTTLDTPAQDFTAAPAIGADRLALFPGPRAWAVVALAALVDLTWILLSPLELPVATLVQPVGTVLCTLLGVALISRVKASSPAAERRFKRVGLVLQGLVFLNLAWIALRLLNHVTMATAIPLADPALAHVDALLGLDWAAYFRFVHDRPALLSLLDLSYTSLTLLSTLAYLVFMLATDARRGRFFLETFLFTAVLCIAIGMFFPAAAAVAFYGVDLSAFPNFSEPPGLYHMHHLDALRSGGPVVLNLADMPGLVTFPSFHTAAGIVLVAAAWRTFAFWPACLYSSVMIASTPVFGGHYFADLFAGGVAAALVVSVTARRPEYAGLFAPRATRPQAA